MGPALLVLVVAWAAVALGLSLYGRRTSAPDERFDAIVVLGCRVLPSGRPSLALAERTRRAVQLWHEGRAPLLVLTGGVGDAPASEAEVAAEIAREHGVPESALVIESRSTSTEENARFAAALVDARDVLLVTDDHHVLRAERVFAKYFRRVRGVGTANPHLWPRIRGSLREVVALAGYAAMGRI
jgi:uncharacterized SAM-binding protein YcdF (DUF218 family)